MSSIATSLIVFACVFASALVGMFLRRVLPQHHLNGDSKAVVQLGMGLVVTLAALVLGLLVSSAKGFYDMQSAELTQLSANVVLLDRTLAHYGSDGKGARGILRGAVVHIVDPM
jgi:O-antigen/teichoic acid export membrane protein